MGLAYLRAWYTENPRASTKGVKETHGACAETTLPKRRNTLVGKRKLREG